MHDTPESEIKFEDKTEVVQWIEVNLKQNKNMKCMLVCATDSLITKQNNINVYRNHCISLVKIKT